MNNKAKKIIKFWLTSIMVGNTLCCIADRSQLTNCSFISQTKELSIHPRHGAQHGFTVDDNPYKYSSYYSDLESKLYYLKARYYSPEFMHFISRDTYNLSNRYAYCGGNPIERIDPDGHLDMSFLNLLVPNSPGAWAGFGIGAALVGLTGVAGLPFFDSLVFSAITSTASNAVGKAIEKRVPYDSWQEFAGDTAMNIGTCAVMNVIGKLSRLGFKQQIEQRGSILGESCSTLDRDEAISQARCFFGVGGTNDYFNGIKFEGKELELWVTGGMKKNFLNKYLFNRGLYPTGHAVLARRAKFNGEKGYLLNHFGDNQGGYALEFKTTVEDYKNVATVNIEIPGKYIRRVGKAYDLLGTEYFKLGMNCETYVGIVFGNL